MARRRRRINDLSLGKAGIRGSLVKKALHVALAGLDRRNLGKLRLACTIESIERRRPDWVFVFYTSILVRLHG